MTTDPTTQMCVNALRNAVAALAAVICFACGPATPGRLTEAHVAQINRWLDPASLPHPRSVTIDDLGYVVATVDLPGDRPATSARYVGSSVLWCMRGALAGEGFSKFRVEVMEEHLGRARRAGVARFVESGAMQWDPL